MEDFQRINHDVRYRISKHKIFDDVFTYTAFFVGIFSCLLFGQFESYFSPESLLATVVFASLALGAAIFESRIASDNRALLMKAVAHNLRIQYDIGFREGLRESIESADSDKQSVAASRRNLDTPPEIKKPKDFDD